MSADLLVIARHDDPHVPLVTTAMSGLGRSCTVLPIGLDRAHYAVFGDFPALDLDVDGHRYRNGEFDRVLYLPMAVNRPPLVECGPDVFGAREWAALLESVFMLWAARRPDSWLIRPDADILHDRKLALLAKAAEAGLSLPPTLVSTLVTDIDLRALGGQVVAKAINAWQEIEPGRYFNTSLLEETVRRTITRAGRLATPAMLQSFVEHRTEYRCYSVTGDLLKVVLETVTGAVDARLDGSVSRVSLSDEPCELARKLVELTATLGLSYCCYDVLVDSDGRHWLTDVNPVGSWAYLRTDHGVDLTPWIMGRWMREKP